MCLVHTPKVGRVGEAKWKSQVLLIIARCDGHVGVWAVSLELLGWWRSFGLTPFTTCDLWAFVHSSFLGLACRSLTMGNLPEHLWSHVVPRFQLLLRVCPHGNCLHCLCRDSCPCGLVDYLRKKMLIAMFSSHCSHYFGPKSELRLILSRMLWGMPCTQCEVLNVGQYSDPTFGPF